MGRYGKPIYSNHVSFDTWFMVFKKKPGFALTLPASKRIFRNLKDELSKWGNLFRAAFRGALNFILKALKALANHYQSHQESYDLIFLMLVSYASMTALFYLFFGIPGLIFYNKIMAVFSGMGLMFTISELFENKSAA